MLCTHWVLTCLRGQLASESEDNFVMLFQLRYHDSPTSLAAGWPGAGLVRIAGV